MSEGQMQPDLVCDLGYVGCNLTWSVSVRRGRPTNDVVVFVYVIWGGSEVT